MRVLYEASHAFAEEVGDPARLADTIAGACSELVGDFSAVTLLKDGGEWLEQVAVYHPDPELQREYRAFSSATPARLGEGVTGKVMLEDKPLLLAVVDPETIAARAPEGYKD